MNSLRETIAQQLSTDPHVGTQPVRFEIVGEDVVLMGEVRTYFQKQMAQQAVRRIEGVG